MKVLIIAQVVKSGKLSSLLLGIVISLSFADFASAGRKREGRAVHEIFLSDPLDCLSQLVCGLNTFPPHPPSARTSSANDYAYLLQNVVIRLRKQASPNQQFQRVPTLWPVRKNVSTTTTTPPALLSAADLLEDSEEDDESKVKKIKKFLLKNSKDQDEDVVEMKGLYPPFGILDFLREGRKVKGKGKGKNSKSKPNPKRKPSALDLLQSEQDIRMKLRSDAQCMYGILDHTCPFRYSELLILMAGVLERQRVISYSTNRILPMVGYLLKSRSLTQTLKASFFALEKINNITLLRDQREEPISFSHVYEEILRGDPGGTGLQLVETKNDALANSNQWEDDEFDAALKTPFLPREKIPGYAIKDRSKKRKKNGSQEKDQQEDAENSATAEEGEDEGVIIPHPNADPFTIGDMAGFLREPEDEEESDEGGSVEVESKEDIPLPPVWGGAVGGNNKGRSGNILKRTKRF